MKIKRMVNGEMMEFELTANERWLAHEEQKRLNHFDELDEWLEDHADDYDGEGLTQPNTQEREDIVERYAEKLEEHLDFNWPEIMEEAYTWIMM